MNSVIKLRSSFPHKLFGYRSIQYGLKRLQSTESTSDNNTSTNSSQKSSESNSSNHDSSSSSSSSTSSTKSSKSINDYYDIVICGGGMVGSAMAYILGKYKKLKVNYLFNGQIF